MTGQSNPQSALSSLSVSTQPTNGFRFASQNDEFAATGFTERFVEFGGNRLHFVEGGQGTPLLLVPGWPQTWLAWRKMMPVLARHYRVIAVDPPGLGDSAPPADGQYDTANVANILHQLVLKLGLAKIIYVGHDVGVWIGYNYAALYGSEGVAHLTLIDGTIPGVAPVQADPWDPIWVTRSWHFFFNQLEDLPEQLTAGHEQEYLTWWFRSKALRPDCFTNQEIAAYCHEYSKPNRLTQGWAYYRAIPSTVKINRQFATKPLAMPVLAIGGSNSAGLNLARAIAQSTPDVVGEVIAESGHFVPEERPERTAAVLLGALSTANL